MSLRNCPHRYGSVAITFHWLSALLIVLMLGLGFAADNATDDAAKAALLRIHVPLGVTILILTVCRLLWKLLTRQPGPVPGVPRWQERASKAVHGALYLLIFILCGSGIGLIALSGAGPVLFGGSPPPLPDFGAYPPMAAHALGAFALILLAALHILAALHHQFIRRDHLLVRMGIGRAGEPGVRRISR